MEVLNASPTLTVRAGGERRLFMAVLEDAVRRVRKSAGDVHASPRQIQADLDWFYSDDRSWPCSFLNLCGYLGLDPQWVRGQLRSELQAASSRAWLRPRRPLKFHFS